MSSRRTLLSKVSLIVGLVFALLSGANALGIGHRDDPDCPHCVVLAVSRRRFLDTATVTIEAHFTSQKFVRVAPKHTAIAPYLSALLSTPPLPLVASILVDETVPIAYASPFWRRPIAGDSHSRGPPPLAWP